MNRSSRAYSYREKERSISLKLCQELRQEVSLNKRRTMPTKVERRNETNRRKKETKTCLSPLLKKNKRNYPALTNLKLLSTPNILPLTPHKKPFRRLYFHPWTSVPTFVKVTEWNHFGDHLERFRTTGKRLVRTWTQARRRASFEVREKSGRSSWLYDVTTCLTALPTPLGGMGQSWSPGAYPRAWSNYSKWRNFICETRCTFSAIRDTRWASSSISTESNTSTVSRSTMWEHNTRWCSNFIRKLKYRSRRLFESLLYNSEFC